MKKDGIDIILAKIIYKIMDHVQGDKIDLNTEIVELKKINKNKKIIKFIECVFNNNMEYNKKQFFADILTENMAYYTKLNCYNEDNKNGDNIQFDYKKIKKNILELIINMICDTQFETNIKNNNYKKIIENVSNKEQILTDTPIDDTIDDTIYDKIDDKKMLIGGKKYNIPYWYTNILSTAVGNEIIIKIDVLISLFIH